MARLFTCCGLEISGAKLFIYSMSVLCATINLMAVVAVFVFPNLVVFSIFSVVVVCPAIAAYLIFVCDAFYDRYGNSRKFRWLCGEVAAWKMELMALVMVAFTVEGSAVMVFGRIFPLPIFCVILFLLIMIPVIRFCCGSDLGNSSRMSARVGEIGLVPGEALVMVVNDRPVEPDDDFKNVHTFSR